MFEDIDHAYALAGRSYATLKKDPELLAYPVLSVLFSIFYLVVAAFGLASLGQGGPKPPDDLPGCLTVFAIYLLLYCNVYFWDVALLTGARQRLQGGDPTFTSGLAGAFGNMGRVVSWGILAATVGLVVDLIQRKVKNSRWLAGLVNDLWSVTTYFVLPVMIFEKLGPSAALVRSKQIVARTWGQAFTGYVGLSVLYEVFLLPAGLLGGLGWVLAPQHRTAILCLLISYAVLVTVYLSALEQVYRAGVYLQAQQPVFASSAPLPLGAAEPFPSTRSVSSCPRCYDPFHTKVVEGVSVDLCDRCGGLWLDRGEAECLLRSQPLPDFLTNPPARQQSVEFRRQGQRECPRCSVALQLAAVEGVQLDGCAQCGGVFLDRGELAELHGKI